MAQIDLGTAENSHLIQLHTDETTLWRGNEWSKLSIFMKVNKVFHNETDSLKVRAFIENGSTGSVYHPATSGKIRMTVKTREKENDLTLSNVARDIRGCSKINVELHKDLFSDGSNIRAIVGLFRAKDEDEDKSKHTQNPRHESSSIVAFGATQYITVTDHALSIQRRFQNSEKVVKVPKLKNAYIFYKDATPRHDSLKVAISVLDENRESCAEHLPCIKLKTELVYENGQPAPLLPYGKQVSGMTFDGSKGKLLKKLNEPKLGDGIAVTDLKFLIQQVIFHHHGHDGFKIKVSLESGQDLIIHPAIMKEMIAVLSKPKKITTKTLKASKLNLVTPNTRRPLMVVRHSGPGSPIATLAKTVQSRYRKKRKQSSVTINHGEKRAQRLRRTQGPKKKEKNTIPSTTKKRVEMIPIPISVVMSGYLYNGKCLSCDSSFEHCRFLQSASHSAHCKFAARILPILGPINICPKKEKRTVFPPIFKTESFDVPLINRIPSQEESINESIFESGIERPLLEMQEFQEIIGSWNDSIFASYFNDIHEV